MGRYQGARSGRTRRTRKRLTAASLIVLLALLGAAFDPAIIAPFGPFAAPPEEVSSRFTRCGQGPSFACVVDGDTLRLGQRRVRVTGIDAPELRGARCPAEREQADRAADRLVELVNAGPFEMVAHRFNMVDRHGRELRVLRRDGKSIGSQLVAEGLAHRYRGIRQDWC